MPSKSFSGTCQNMLLVKDQHDLDTVKCMVTKLASFLSKYSSLTDAFVLEFFTECHWDKLPASWQHVLSKISLIELADWLSPESISTVRYKEVWPLSLQAFGVTATNLRLSRKPEQSMDALRDVIRMTRSVVGATASGHDVISGGQPPRTNQTSDAKLNNENCQRKVLHPNFARHVKPKKQHEIVRLAEIVNVVMEECQNQQVVDIGSGQGHLSRLMSFGYGYKVLSLEAEGNHVDGAKTLDGKLVREILKRKTVETQTCSIQPPSHVIQKVDASLTGQEFLQMLKQASGCKSIDEVPPFAVVGLHACGDLSATMTKVFTDCPQAVALVSVACCYMKITSGGSKTGYPLSRFVSELPNPYMSYEAREVACHALELYQQRLRTCSEKLKIHCYRATLEAIIAKYHPSKRRMGLRGVKAAERMTFGEYAKVAMGKLDLGIPEEEYQSSFVDECMSRWKDVIVFFTLRLLLAPVLETMILLDRQIFICEKGYSSLLCPLFDPLLSPRNHVLVAFK